MSGLVPPSRRLDIVFSSGAANPLTDSTTRRFWPVPAGSAEVPRFSIEITRPDGTVERSLAVGGSSVGHASDAMDRAGLGAVVRITKLPTFLTEPA